VSGAHRAAAAATVALLLAGCGDGSVLGQTRGEKRYRRDQIQVSLRRLETPGVVLGIFTVARSAVVDGDTFKVDGLQGSMRLLGLDTEEKFWHENEKRAFEAVRFDQYVKNMRGSSGRPVKMATPMGEAASHFAKEFFADVREVRIERDRPKEIRDRYDRYLAYVLVMRDGTWVNYNVECVRAGMSPYFTKYGYSARYHDELAAAQQEARAAHRGIWDPTTRHYPDYEERMVWWEARAKFVQEFYDAAGGRDEYISLSEWDALRRLEEHVGKEVTLLGTVSKVKLGDKGPTRVLLGRRIGADFPLVFFDKDAFLSTGLGSQSGEFVRVTGTVNRYHNRRTGRDELQIVVELPSQVKIADLPPPRRPPEQEKKP
jgi:endonuclease YncB( thermonuclease family)